MEGSRIINKDMSFQIYLAELTLFIGFALASIQIWISHNDDKMFLFGLCFMALAVLAADGVVRTARKPTA